MKKINEIFYSLQGEGFNAGIPSVFLRFSGCNLSCEFCDTCHEDGVLMEDQEIASAISSFPGKWIILTGGEPALWIDMEFIDFLKKSTGKKIAIETNGTRALPDNLDWVTVSPKTGFKGGSKEELKVKRANEVKVIYMGQNLEEYFNFPFVNNETVMSLQPCYVPDEESFKHNVDSAVAKVLSDPRWRLSLQLHRFLGIK